MYFNLPEPGNVFISKRPDASKLTNEQRMYLYRQCKKGISFSKLQQELPLTKAGVAAAYHRMNRRIGYLKNRIAKQYETARKLDMTIWEYRKKYCKN